MPHGDIETVYDNGKWHNRIAGYTTQLNTFITKAEAIEAGRFEAGERQVEHIIKDTDGTIEEKNFYGHGLGEASG